MRHCKSTKLLKKTITFQLLVELDQNSMVYQLPMINQTLCMVQILEIHAVAGLYLRFELRVEVGDNKIQICIRACNH